MDRPTCETCPYWMIEPNEPDRSRGECRRNAPKPSPTGQNVNVDVEYWPQVFNDAWCGEHPDFPAYIEGLRPGRKPFISGEMMDRGLSIRAQRILGDATRRAGKCITDLTDEDISKVRNCGGQALMEIRKFITACLDGSESLKHQEAK